MDYWENERKKKFQEVSRKGNIKLFNEILDCEAFVVFLDEFHVKSELTSLSVWKDIYEIICKDERFYKILFQPGSTSLDLFKFDLLKLKFRFFRDKRLVSKVLEDKKFTFNFNTNLELFLKVIELEERGRTLDPGYVRMANTSLIEKADSIEKQRKEEVIY